MVVKILINLFFLWQEFENSNMSSALDARVLSQELFNQY